MRLQALNPHLGRRWELTRLPEGRRPRSWWGVSIGGSDDGHHSCQKKTGEQEPQEHRSVLPHKSPPILLQNRKNRGTRVDTDDGGPSLRMEPSRRQDIQPGVSRSPLVLTLIDKTSPPG